MEDVVEKRDTAGKRNHPLDAGVRRCRLRGGERYVGGLAHSTPKSARQNGRTRGHARTMSSRGSDRQRPRVKSGTFTGRLFRETDCTVSPTRLLSAAASYTFMSVGSP